MCPHDDDGATSVDFLIAVFVLSLTFAGSCMVEAIECSTDWAMSGLTTSWGPLKGCLVRTVDGHYIPAKTVKGSK